MEAYLYDHAAFGSGGLKNLSVVVDRPSPTLLQLHYSATGRINEIIVPSPAPVRRRANLWQQTCFELFVRSRGTSVYREFNFSPSGEWAAYAFDSYRHGMQEAYLPADPHIEVTRTDDRFEMLVRLSPDLRDEPYDFGLSAVIESVSGMAYWAVSHPSDRPDFHDPACFTLELPPATAA